MSDKFELRSGVHVNQRVTDGRTVRRSDGRSDRQTESIVAIYSIYSALRNKLY